MPHAVIWFTWFFWVLACLADRKMRGTKGGFSILPVIPVFPLAASVLVAVLNAVHPESGGRIIAALHVLLLCWMALYLFVTYLRTRKSQDEK